MSMVDPYESEAYREHVRHGYCPVISSGKSWCSAPAGHGGRHWSPWLSGPGATAIRAYWTEEWRSGIPEDR